MFPSGRAHSPGRECVGGEGLALIRLEGLSVFGHHGARPYEKEAGQRLEVDLELEPTDDRSEKSDKLSDAVDYDELYKTVREVVERERVSICSRRWPRPRPRPSSSASTCAA